MNARSQCGATLAEAAVALAIVSLVIAGLSSALLPAAHRLSGDARTAALQRLCDRTLREARDVLKYDGSSVLSRTVTLSEATVDLRVTSGASGTLIAVTATASDGTSARASTTIAARAPQPGSTFASGTTVAAPTGAP